MAGPPTSSDLPPLSLRAEHFLGDLPNGDALGLFGGDGAVHELERLPFASAFLGKDPHAGSGRRRSACRGCTSVIGTQRATLSVAIDHDAAIHFLVGNSNPLAVEPDLGALVGRAVKPFGKRPRDVGVFQPGVVERSRHGAMIGDLGQDFR